MTNKKTEKKPKKEKKNPKGTMAEVEARVHIVLQLYTTGLNAHNILEYFREKLEIKVSFKTIEYYITRAREKLKEVSKFKVDEEFGKAITRLENLYMKAYHIHDYRTCLSVQKEINELLGLIIIKLDHTSGGEPLEGNHEPMIFVIDGKERTLEELQDLGDKLEKKTVKKAVKKKTVKKKPVKKKAPKKKK